MTAAQAIGSEKALHLLWRRAAALKEPLMTTGGESIRVVYPGRPSAQSGPDFRDALIVTGEGRVVRGDVELHMDASGWRQHGHYQDPNYNGVVLHVVLRARGRNGPRLQSGMRPRLLSMRPIVEALGRADGSRMQRAIAPDGPGVKDIESLLDQWGDLRFQAKAKGMAMEVERHGADQALYMGMMEAMGYGENKRPFLQLCTRAPIATLLALGSEPYETRLVAIRALLLRTSGLLAKTQSHPQHGEMLAVLKSLPPTEPMPTGQWRLFRIRPNNHPARRILGIADVVNHCINGGPAATLVNAFQREGLAPMVKSLEAKPYIGASKAKDVSANVVLPFVYVWAQMSGDRALEDASHRAYDAHPTTSENQITREARRLLSLEGGRAGLVDSARRQQGLIHYYKSLGSSILGLTTSS